MLLLCYLTDMNSAQNRRCPTTVFGCEVCFRFQQFILCDLNRNLAHIFSWHVFRSWGRVGTSIGGTKLETFRSVDNAIENFNEVYFDKTGTFVMMVDWHLPHAVICFFRQWEKLPTTVFLQLRGNFLWCFYKSMLSFCWYLICASLNHREKMKAEPSRLVPRKRTNTSAGMANQSGIKSRISYWVTAKSHIRHMGTHEHHPISSSRTHILLLS